MDFRFKPVECGAQWDGRGAAAGMISASLGRSSRASVLEREQRYADIFHRLSNRGKVIANGQFALSCVRFP
jgi:L-aminopeptidase/D-esterase-like protein